MVNIDKYNREKFVNREQPLAIIQEKLDALYADAPPEESKLINFWGMGGKGKTFLKKQLKTMYDSKNNTSPLSNYLIIDWNGDAFLNKTYSLPEILIYFRNEFVRYGFEMNEFTKFITYYRKCTSASLPDIIDENEESVTKSIFKGIFDFISQASGFGAAINGLIDISQTTSRKKKNNKLKKEYEDFSSLDAGTMLAIVLEAFIEDINREIKDRKIIFIIDTFEDVRTINMDWIFSKKTEFKHMPGLFYAIQPSLWIVFGRDEANLNDNQTSFQLENFNIPETTTYIQENLQMVSEENAEKIISYSNGYPLLLSELHHELSSTQANVTAEFFEQLQAEEKKETLITHRYKKYFSESFNDTQNIYLLKILFTFRQWTIHKEDIIGSDVYQFTKTYHGNMLQTIDLESKLQQLLQLSFINELSNTKYATTYEIDKSIYTALFDQNIDGIPVISNELKNDVISFLLQKLTNKAEEDVLETDTYTYIQADENQAEVTQMIDLLFSLYKDDEPAPLYEKVMQLLQENHADKSITAFIQIIILERFSKDFLATQPGQQMITSALNYFQSFGIVEYIDRFVYLLNEVNHEQLLNERLGHYFLSIGRLSYAKLYLEKAIPTLDKFKNAMALYATEKNNKYNNPSLLTLTVDPAELIEGFEFVDDHAAVFEGDMYLYRKFLYNTRQLIRTQIELGDNEELLPLLTKWEVTIYLDEINEDENVMHALWLHIDVIMLQKSVWFPTVLKELERTFIPELYRNKSFAIEHPSFIISVFKLSNSLFEFGHYQLQEMLYDYITDVLQLIIDPKIQNHYDLGPFLEMFRSSSYQKCMVQREIIMYPMFGAGSESESIKIKQNLSNYYERRVAESWQLPLELEELVDTGSIDLKVMSFLNLKDDYIDVLDTIIDKLEHQAKDSLHLGEYNYLKGIYLLDSGDLLESYPCFHEARNIIYQNLGPLADTSKTLIPYEAHDLFTRYRLLKKNLLPMDKHEFESFRKRAELNQTMIMNSYEDDLPDAIKLYLMSVECVEGIESIVYEDDYQNNIKQVNALLDTASDRQLNLAVQELGRYFFLDVTEKYNREHLFYKNKLTPIPLAESVRNVVQHVKHDWDNDVVPEDNKEQYYQIVAQDLQYLMNNRNDFETFFNLYFRQLQNIFHGYHRQMNQVGTDFEQVTDIIIDIQFANNNHRNNILNTLISAFR